MESDTQPEVPPAPEDERNDISSVVDKMMNMIMHLRHEIDVLWNRNTVLEKKLVEKSNAVCDTEGIAEEQPVLRSDEGDGEKAQRSSFDEDDGGKATEGVDDVCSPLRCLSPSEHLED
jgi:hypothetical protein